VLHYDSKYLYFIRSFFLLLPEDKMAMIFVAIVTGFLLSNFPRIFLNFHEVIVLDVALACGKAGMR
jgi:hypothetical protein